MRRDDEVINLYFALADLGTMTEPEGRALIKQIYPERAHEVDALVKAFEDEACGRSPMASKLQSQLAELRANSRIDPNSNNLNDTIRSFGRQGRGVLPAGNGTLIES